MKQAALFMIALSVAAAGIGISSRFGERVKMLKSVCLFISAIKTEVEFSLESAVEIFERLSPVYSSDLPFVGACRDMLQNGESFEKAWAQSVMISDNTKSLKDEDIQLLLSFGKSFGTTDVSGQTANCDIHIRFFQQNLQKADNEMKLYRKPAAALGILSGAGIYILFM